MRDPSMWMALIDSQLPRLLHVGGGFAYRLLKRAIRLSVGGLLFGLTFTTASAEILNVPQHIWDRLNPEQQTGLSERFAVNIVSDRSYGTIIDVQTLDESSRGTTGGSQLGAAYGSAAYVDKAFKGSNWNYSATNHLTAQIAGALVGSLADQPAAARFRTRYTIKTGDGGVVYEDEIKSDAFHHSLGLCVALGPMRPIEVAICNLTPREFLERHPWLTQTAYPGQTGPGVQVEGKTKSAVETFSHLRQHRQYGSPLKLLRTWFYASLE